VKDFILSVLKWWFIIAFTGATFYLVYPKYTSAGHPKLVLNTITGELYKPSVQKQIKPVD